jgi:hypothetical protein
LNESDLVDLVIAVDNQTDPTSRISIARVFAEEYRELSPSITSKKENLLLI